MIVESAVVVAGHKLPEILCHDIARRRLERGVVIEKLIVQMPPSGSDSRFASLPYSPFIIQTGISLLLGDEYRLVILKEEFIILIISVARAYQLQMQARRYGRAKIHLGIDYAREVGLPNPSVYVTLR